MEVLGAVRELTAAVDGLCDADAPQLANGETVQALHRQLERLSAVTTRAAAAFDAGREWEADGAKSAAAWLGRRCRVPVVAARRRVTLGRALRHMPAVDAAWLAGEIGEAHVVVLAAARTPETAEVFVRDEAMLVDQARTLSYRNFARAVAYWRQAADADGADAEAEAQHRRRRLHLSQTFAGNWVLDGRLDPISGAIVAKTLKAIDDELFAADWAASSTRTPAQRRADALVEMARRARAMPAGARLPEPLFTVLVGYESFAGSICELAGGTVVAPGALVRWLGEAWVERVVFDGPARVTEVGVRRRIFTGAVRRAIQVRDRECFDEFCDVAADDAEIDHVVPWSAGGLTTEANGRVACGYHNRRRHPGGRRGDRPP